MKCLGPCISLQVVVSTTSGECPQDLADRHADPSVREEAADREQSEVGGEGDSGAADGGQRPAPALAQRRRQLILPMKDAAVPMVRLPLLLFLRPSQ